MRINNLLVLILTLTFFGCKPYGTQLEHESAQIYYTEPEISVELAEKLTQALEEFGWINSVPKSILYTKKNDTIQVNLVTLDRLRSDIPTEKQIAAIGIQLSRKLNLPISANMADNFLKAIRIYPAKVYKENPLTYADTSISQETIQTIYSAVITDSNLVTPEYIYIKKAGPAYHIHMTYPNTDSIDLYHYQDWANTMRAEKFEGKQVDVYISDPLMKESEVLFGRRN